MTVLDFKEYRDRRAFSASAARAFAETITQVYVEQGRDLAELAHPILEPFHQCEPTLEKHLGGAFLRWQASRIKTIYRDDAQAVGLARAVLVEAFTNRLIEIRYGFDPTTGPAA